MAGQRGAPGGQRLRPAHAQGVTRHRPFQTRIGAPSLDDGADAYGAQGGGPDRISFASVHAPKQMPVVDTGRLHPRFDPEHRGRTQKQHDPDAFLVRLGAPHGSQTGAVGLEVDIPATSRAANSEMRSRPSDITAMIAASRSPKREPSPAAMAAVASACEKLTPLGLAPPAAAALAPDPPASTRSVAGPVGEGAPFSLARKRIAATVWAQVAGAGDFSLSANRPAR